MSKLSSYNRKKLFVKSRKCSLFLFHLIRLVDSTQSKGEDSEKWQEEEIAAARWVGTYANGWLRDWFDPAAKWTSEHWFIYDHKRENSSSQLDCSRLAGRAIWQSKWWSASLGWKEKSILAKISSRLKANQCGFWFDRSIVFYYRTTCNLSTSLGPAQPSPVPT